jgi:hypothetical protein
VAILHGGEKPIGSGGQEAFPIRFELVPGRDAAEFQSLPNVTLDESANGEAGVRRFDSHWSQCILTQLNPMSIFTEP